jgi:hypothetical protein
MIGIKLLTNHDNCRHRHLIDYQMPPIFEGKRRGRVGGAKTRSGNRERRQHPSRRLRCGRGIEGSGLARKVALMLLDDASLSFFLPSFAEPSFLCINITVG